jgi:hypothetical protein
MVNAGFRSLPLRDVFAYEDDCSLISARVAPRSRP